MKKTKKTAKAKTTKPVSFLARLKTLGKTYEAKGESVSEAISNLKPDGKVAGTSILTVFKGEASKVRILGTAQAVRLFSESPLTREITLKNVSLLFDI